MRPSPHLASRTQIFSWTLFDLANTAFYVLILTVGYPLYFKEVVAAGRPDGDFLWGATFSLSMLIVALLSPILGAASDSGAGKKRFLFLFTALCILATGSLFFVIDGMIVAGMLLLIASNIGFEAGLVFYDAFLPELTTERWYGRISGYGYAMGYVGSLATLALAFPLLQGGFGDENLLNVRLSFLMAAGLLFLFALPIFIFVPDRQHSATLPRGIIREGLRRVASTFKEISLYRNITRFLVAYFLYFDGINTVIIFSSLYARETLQFEMTEIVIFFAMVQSSAIVGSLVFGWLADRFGQKRILSTTLLLWIAIVTIGYFAPDKATFFAVGVLAGLALGSSQSTSRSLMSVIIPAYKKTEFFGFYSFFGKASAILGPLMFGIISSAVDQRTAILSVGLLFLTGFIMLQRVKEEAHESTTDPGRS